jgi:maltose alpha-D-glucosyltransferase/alpha-amylase
LLQAYVPNQGDGWGWMLERLAQVAEHGLPGDDFAPEGRLGRRTGELHVALSGVSLPSFAPEPLSESFANAQVTRAERAAKDAAMLLGERAAVLPPSVQRALPAIREALHHPAGQMAGFRAEIGGMRTRVHGDYHLGQTLRTLDDDWEIIDFEGEPARPVGERRQKLSVLKDVAGMLRSFSYARGAVERATQSEDARLRLARWEQGAREAFVSEYRASIAEANFPLVPMDDAAFAPATSAWEFDKAVYEIVYEARNRPDWLEIPLRSLFPDILAQASDATGAAPA